MGMDVEQFAHLLGNGHIEIKEKLPTVFKKRADIVFVKLKERTLAIGTLQCVPMLRAPFAVVADADILDFCFAQGYPFPTGASTGTVSACTPWVVAMTQRLR